MSISVRPLSYALGAEIQGVDLAKPLSNSEFDQIHRTFLDRGILLFRDQKITREQHIAFSRRFGDLEIHPFLPAPEGSPEVVLLANDPDRLGRTVGSLYALSTLGSIVGALGATVSSPPTTGSARRRR